MPEAAAIRGLSAATSTNCAATVEGPRYVRQGRSILYRQDLMRRVACQRSGRRRRIRARGQGACRKAKKPATRAGLDAFLFGIALNNAPTLGGFSAQGKVRMLSHDNGRDRGGANGARVPSDRFRERRAAFREAAARRGLKLPPRWRARNRRCPVADGKPGALDGAYVRISMEFQQDISKISETDVAQRNLARGYRTLATVAGIESAGRAHRERALAADDRVHAGKGKRPEDAGDHSWRDGSPAPPDHPYLAKKGVGAHGLKLDVMAASSSALR